MTTVIAPARRANIADFRLSLGDTDLRGDVFSVLELLDITEKVRPRLISLTLTEKRGEEADQLDLILDDADGKLELPRKGQLIRLSLGWRQGSDVTVGLVDKGSFTVDEVEWEDVPPTVRLTARSADLTAGFRRPRETSHRDTTLGAIAQKVASANGYRARVAPELADIAVPVLAQHHQSDMSLLRRLGREHDAVATVKDRTLILSPIGKGLTASGKALPALTINRGDGAGARYRELKRDGDAPVEARWHDDKTAERKTVTAGGAKPGAGKPRRLRRVYHSEADAQAAAKAAQGKAKRAEAEFEYALALGRPDLYVERPVTLTGFKPPIDAAKWIVAQIDHILDGTGGLATKLKLETL